ncbi:hypothetical protein HDK64DRAFT_315204 [Phyllosticta capitalensis]
MARAPLEQTANTTPNHPAIRTLPRHLWNQAQAHSALLITLKRSASCLHRSASLEVVSTDIQGVNVRRRRHSFAMAANLFTLDRICRSTPVLELNGHEHWPAWRSNLELYLTAHNLWRVVSDPGIHPREPIKQDYFRHEKVITAAGCSLYGVPRSTTHMEIFDEARYVADYRPFDEWKARDAQARLLILATVSVDLALELSRESSSAGMWALLHARFDGNPVAGLAGGGPAAGPGGSGSGRGHQRNRSSRGSIGDGATGGNNGDNGSGNGGIGGSRNEGHGESPGNDNINGKRPRQLARAAEPTLYFLSAV